MNGTIAAVVFGIATWSFAEYALHTWVFHGLRGWGPSRLHLEHHAKPDWFAPASAKALSALVFCTIAFPVAMWTAGLSLAVVYTTVFVATYLTYEFLHRRAHTHPPRGPYGRWLRKHHLYHHFGHPLRNQGVTTPIWDLAFGTHEDPGRVRVPRRFAASASPWLIGPDGEVKPELAADYVLVGAPARDRQEQLDHEAAFANIPPAA